MQTRIFLFFFLTGTIPEGVPYFPYEFGCDQLVNLSLDFSRVVGVHRLGGLFNGRWSGSISKWCAATTRSRVGISKYVHVDMSWFHSRNLRYTSFSLRDILPLMSIGCGSSSDQHWLPWAHLWWRAPSSNAAGSWAGSTVSSPSSVWVSSSFSFGCSGKVFNGSILIMDTWFRNHNPLYVFGHLYLWVKSFLSGLSIASI